HSGPILLVPAGQHADDATAGDQTLRQIVLIFFPRFLAHTRRFRVFSGGVAIIEDYAAVDKYLRCKKALRRFDLDVIDFDRAAANSPNHGNGVFLWCRIWHGWHSDIRFSGRLFAGFSSQ